MARKWSDISREVDEMSRGVLWTPDTPRFLEDRARRQSSRTRPPASYTQVKASIRQNRKLYPDAGANVARSSRGDATIIDFGTLERTSRAGHAAPARGGSYYGGRGGYRYPVDYEPWGFPAERQSHPQTPSSREGGLRYHQEATPARGESRRRNRPGFNGDERRADPALFQPGSRYPGSRNPAAASPAGFRDRGMGDGEYEEAGEEGAPARASLGERLRKARHDARHRKADRAFSRDFEDSPMGDDGPRAAVYQTKMGRQHQRAARMQAQAAGARFGGMPNFALPIFDFLMGRRHFVTASLAVLCVAVFTAMVFPAVQDYYVQMRTNEQIEAEYQAVLERNAQLERRVSSLQTDEGMAELAHESLGWVRDGEHSVSVMAEGSSDIGTGTPVEASSIASGSVPAPTTWYSPVLDALFGYQG